MGELGLRDSFGVQIMSHSRSSSVSSTQSTGRSAQIRAVELGVCGYPGESGRVSQLERDGRRMGCWGETENRDESCLMDLSAGASRGSVDIKKGESGLRRRCGS